MASNFPFKKNWFHQPPVGIQSNPDYSPNKNLICHLPCSEGAGLTAFDISNYKRHGEFDISTGASWTIGLRGGRAIHFTSNDGKVDVGSSYADPIGAEERTISFNCINSSVGIRSHVFLSSNDNQAPAGTAFEICTGNQDVQINFGKNTQISSDGPNYISQDTCSHVV